MVNGIEIISERFKSYMTSLSDLLGRRRLGKLDGATNGIFTGLDGGTRRLLAEFAEKSGLTYEDAAACWIARQASEYEQNKEIERLWSTLTHRGWYCDKLLEECPHWTYRY